MKNLVAIITGLFFAVGLVFSLQAKNDDDVINKLSAFKASGADYSWDRVPQDTKYSENVKKNIISKLKLPANFKVELFAVVPDARNMAVSRNKGAVWIGTRKDRVWQATDRDMDNVADTVERFAPNIKFDIPNGPCYSADGHLYIA